MPAYLIGRVQMRNPAWVAEYGEKIQPLIRKYGDVTGTANIILIKVSNTKRSSLKKRTPQ